MASLHFTPSSSCFTLPKQKLPHSILIQTPIPQKSNPKPSKKKLNLVVRSYKVVIEHEGQTTNLEVEPDETILEKAIESGMDIPHDCKLGVCMTCPARLVSGSVDQSEGMLSDDVIDGGYTLLCVSYPRSDCSITTIPEEELLSLQLATAND